MNKKLYCYVMKCTGKLNKRNAYEFTVGKTYYARSDTNIDDSISIHDDVSMLRRTGLTRYYFVNDNEIIQKDVIFLGYTWSLVKIVEVDSDFNFAMGTRSLTSVLSSEDLALYNKCIFEYEHRGGSLEPLTMLTCKYHDAMQLEDSLMLDRSKLDML